MFVKHIGKHNNRKVAVVFRQVPDEDHMALVCYTEAIPTMFHDAIMQVIESAPGQAVDELSEVLHRNFLSDGRGILEGLHKEGLLKKVPTSQVIVTPNPQSHVRLDELNKIINDLQTGSEAAEAMKKLDDSIGMVDPAQQRAENLAKEQVNEAVPPVQNEVLDDTTLAKNLMAQAEAMIAESQRLQEQAFTLDESLKPKKKAVRKKAVRKKAATKKKAKATVTESVKSETSEPSVNESSD